MYTETSKDSSNSQIVNVYSEIAFNERPTYYLTKFHLLYEYITFNRAMYEKLSNFDPIESINKHVKSIIFDFNK